MSDLDSKLDHKKWVKIFFCHKWAIAEFSSYRHLGYILNWIQDINTKKYFSRPHSYEVIVSNSGSPTEKQSPLSLSLTHNLDNKYELCKGNLSVI